jgi:acetylornithine aminotransferase
MENSATAIETTMQMFDVYHLFDIDITKASGSTLWDSKGKEYLDLYGGHAVISVGHSHPEYVQALTKQLQSVSFYSNSIYIKQQEELAQKLGRLSGYNDYQLFLCNSGAEANENAFKLASFYTGKKKVIAFSKSFHGRTSLAVAATDNPQIVAPINQNEHIVFLPLNDTFAFDNTFSDDVACVIIEGIQGVAGVYAPTIPFLQHIEKACKAKNIPLILDEVQSGYGRTGKFFAHQRAGIKPDIITIAKGMGNGFPVAGVMIAPHIKAKKEMLGTTFGGNYLACAAAIAVLDIIEKENLIANAQEQGKYLVSKLQNISKVREIRGLGLMIGIELYEPCAEVRRALLEKYHIFVGSSSNKNTIRILPSLAITETQINQFIDAFKSVIT